MQTHPTHTTRYSDSSLYDEVCTKCGANDAPGRGQSLELPCQGSIENLEAMMSQPTQAPLTFAHFRKVNTSRTLRWHP